MLYTAFHLIRKTYLLHFPLRAYLFKKFTCVIIPFSFLLFDLVFVYFILIVGLQFVTPKYINDSLWSPKALLKRAIFYQRFLVKNSSFCKIIGNHFLRGTSESFATYNSECIGLLRNHYPAFYTIQQFYIEYLPTIALIMVPFYIP